MELKGIELKDGMIIETENRKYWYFNNQVFYKSEAEYIASYITVNYPMFVRYANKCGFMKLDKINEPIKLITYGDKILYEKKEILDEKEKEYLSAVIKPFRNRVKYIIKRWTWVKEFEKEFIIIVINNEAISLPYFEKETMYKGMEVDKKYTLEELGL